MNLHCGLLPSCLLYKNTTTEQTHAKSSKGRRTDARGVNKKKTSLNTKYKCSVRTDVSCDGA